jgi:hypothetical protein
MSTKPTRIRRARTAVLVALFYLLAGAFLSLMVAAVAAGDLDTSSIRRPPGSSPLYGDHDWGAPVPGDWPIETRGADEWCFMAATERRASAQSDAIAKPVRTFDAAVFTVGWPLHCLRGWTLTEITYPPRTPSKVDSRSVHTFDIPMPFAAASLRMPTLPLWPGLVADTLFYAAILLGIVRGPRLVRRWMWGRTGKCTKCGYDTRGLTSNTCPECGSNVPPRSA